MGQVKKQTYCLERDLISEEKALSQCKIQINKT